MEFRKCTLEDMVMHKLLNFYNGKKVYITGHTGFKGSWLAYILHKAGAEVIGFSLNPNTNPSLFSEINLKNKITSQIGDISNPLELEKSILNVKPDFIFHLAAQPLVRYSYTNTIETYNSNIIGTANLLEACKKIDNECVVVCITTDKVYLNNEWDYPYRENDSLGGYDPYSASKAAAEIVIDSYRKSFFRNSGISVASVRAGNVIGGGDWSEDRLIPDFVRSIQQGQSILLRNPYAVRPWQHVLEPLFAYLLLGFKMFENKPDYCEAWNVGPFNHDTKTVLEVCQSLLIHMKNGEIKIEDSPNQLHEAGKLKLDISKFGSAFNWKPKWSSEVAIQRTAEWYKLFIEGNAASNLLDADILAYLDNE